jgi:O-antigen/teichoic acid export membrane protein
MALTEKQFKNIFIYLVPRFASYGLHLITLPVFTRILTPEDFGAVTLALAFPTIAVNLITAGLTASVPRFFFEYRDDIKKLSGLYFSTQLYLILAAAGSLAAVFFAKDFIAELVTGKGLYGPAVFVAYIATYFGQFNTFYLRIYQNMEKASIHSVYVFIQVVINVAVSLLLVWYFQMSYMGMLYGSMAGALVTFIIMSMHFNLRLKVCFSRDILIENLKYGLQVVPKSLTSFINRFFDKYMLNAMLSMSVVGVFSLGQRISSILDVIMENIWMSFQPAYYREVFDKGEEASHETGRMFTIFSYISLLPVVMVVLFANEIMYVIAPAAYHAAGSIIVILSAGATTQIFGRYVSIQYAYTKKPFWIFPITVIGALFNIGANILLIPTYGLVGAGFATVASTTITNILLTVVGQRLYRIHYEWEIIMMLITTIACTMLFMLYAQAYDMSVYAVYALKAAFITAFILLGVRAGIITRQSVGKVKSVLLGAVQKGQA